MNNVLKRTTLIVRDAERSLAAGRPGDRTRLVIMQAQDPVIGMLGLLQFVVPPLAAPAAERQRLALGDVVFVMQTDDVDAVCRRLADWGVRVHAAPHVFEVRGADGLLVRMTSLSFWDPDGYFFEVNQRLAA